uniref:M20/M25/M40 family metallo-hydrolase n=1 Tax=Nocardia cyriacigeorgica TaxID=135487 RepID=UPI00313BE355
NPLNTRPGVPRGSTHDTPPGLYRAAPPAAGPAARPHTPQSGGGEDFSWYLEEVPGAMARLGVWSGEGEQLDLHQPTFDIDERALAVGVRVLSNIVLQAG